VKKGILRKLRKQKELILDVAAEKIGISKNALSGYERGTHQPTAEKLIWIADFYDVSVDYLLGREDK
jgi:transcriptional regulator with XRE-family HTH domain